MKDRSSLRKSYGLSSRHLASDRDDVYRMPPLLMSSENRSLISPLKNRNIARRFGCSKGFICNSCNGKDRWSKRARCLPQLRRRARDVVEAQSRDRRESVRSRKPEDSSSSRHCQRRDRCLMLLTYGVTIVYPWMANTTQKGYRQLKVHR
jgi:hypothetical protein